MNVSLFLLLICLASVLLFIQSQELKMGRRGNLSFPDNIMDYSLILMPEHRPNRNIVQTTKTTKHLSYLSNTSDGYFKKKKNKQKNSYSFRLVSFPWLLDKKY